MEALPAEELAGGKVKYTLDLKGKKVKETELVARADKVRREIGAEVVGGEQIIAAKAQEEAMKHLLPFEQRQSKPWRGSRCGSLRRHRHDGRAVRATRFGVSRTGFDVLGNTHDGERDHEPGDKHDDKRDDKRDDERRAEQGRHCTGRASRGRGRGRGPLRRGVAFASFSAKAQCASATKARPSGACSPCLRPTRRSGRRGRSASIRPCPSPCGSSSKRDAPRCATGSTSRPCLHHGQAADPAAPGPFMRWQDARWKSETVSVRTVRSLGCVYWSDTWTLATWCERPTGFHNFRVDHIEALQVLGSTFHDEPGKTLADLLREVDRERRVQDPATPGGRDRPA